jgi:hypothetical protein
VPDVVDISTRGIVEANPERRSILAHALTGLLVGDLTIATAGLIVPLLNHGDSRFHLEVAVRPVVVLWRIAFAASIAVFLVWFYRARARADGSDWPQRRARGWAFWGWVIPVADLWIPLQIMQDIWRARQPRARCGNLPWLPGLWWASWLLTNSLSQPWTAKGSSDLGYGLLLPANWIGFVPLAVAGVALITIIQTVSSTSDWR